MDDPMQALQRFTFPDRPRRPPSLPDLGTLPVVERGPGDSARVTVKFTVLEWLSEPVTPLLKFGQEESETKLRVTEEDWSAVSRGDVLRNMLSDAGGTPDMEASVVREVRDRALQDGVSLTEQEARLLANFMMVVGKKLAEEAPLK